MRWAVAALIACMAQPVWSLSCLRPDIARDYAFAATSDDRFIIVKGQLSFDGSALPKRNPDIYERPSPETEVTAWFDGYSLTPEGFVRRFERDVLLRVVCLGQWCGGTEPGQHLAFLKQEDTRFVIRLGPCGGMVYRDPSEAIEAKVIQCINGGQCVPEDQSD